MPWCGDLDSSTSNKTKGVPKLKRLVCDTIDYCRFFGQGISLLSESVVNGNLIVTASPGQRCTDSIYGDGKGMETHCYSMRNASESINIRCSVTKAIRFVDDQRKVLCCYDTENIVVIKRSVNVIVRKDPVSLINIHFE